jgi:hypothetical protein
VVGGPKGIAQSGSLAFGAPGLHSAGDATDHSPLVAIVIAAAALLLALFGAQREWRRQELLA